jgi:hypothetical protein
LEYVLTYARYFACPVTRNAFFPTFSTVPMSHPSQCIPIPTQQELNNNCPKVSYKRGRTKQYDTERETKHAKYSVHWLNQISTFNSYTALLEEIREDQQHKTGPENKPKPPPIYLTSVKSITSPIQLLEHIAKQKYEIKALEDNQVKVQPKISKSYRTILQPWPRNGRNSTL